MTLLIIMTILENFCEDATVTVMLQNQKVSFIRFTIFQVILHPQNVKVLKDLAEIMRKTLFEGLIYF